MTIEICPKHGPYHAEAGQCPHCGSSQARPQPPAPLNGLDSDDLPTEVPHMRRPAGNEEDGGDQTIIDRAQGGLLGWLIVTRGGQYGHIYPVRGGAVMGRDLRKADLVLEDEKISGMHARITVRDGKFVLWDLGSSNGTFVNGQEITGATIIQENDEIRMGRMVFVLKTIGEER